MNTNRIVGCVSPLNVGEIYSRTFVDVKKYYNDPNAMEVIGKVIREASREEYISFKLKEERDDNFISYIPTHCNFYEVQILD